MTMDNPSNFTASNDAAASLQGSPTNLMILAIPDLPTNSKTFNDSDIEAFETKYNLDIAPHLAKYCTDTSLMTGNKKRKDNPPPLQILQPPVLQSSGISSTTLLPLPLSSLRLMRLVLQ